MSKELYDGEQIEMDKNLLKVNNSSNIVSKTENSDSVTDRKKYLEQERMEVKRHMDNRFSEFKDMSIEELEDALDEAVIELNEDINIYENPPSPFAKSELHIEINNHKDKIDYIEQLIMEKRGNSR